MTDKLRAAAELALEALTHGCPPDCKDGMIDSGGVHPWGEAALIPCPNCEAIAALRSVLKEDTEGSFAKAEQPAEQEPDGLHLVLAGALFDFAGYMTTRSKVIEVGSTANAAPVADLVKEWANLRGLSLDDAAVLSWQEWLSTAPQPKAEQEADSDKCPHGVWVWDDCEKCSQQPQEPYCYTYTENGEEYFAPPTAYVPDHAKPLYTAPHFSFAESKPSQPTKQLLTDEEIAEMWRKATIKPALTSEFVRTFARAIEAAHGIK